jgi:hypothetical protein
MVDDRNFVVQCNWLKKELLRSRDFLNYSIFYLFSLLPGVCQETEGALSRLIYSLIPSSLNMKMTKTTFYQ